MVFHDRPDEGGGGASGARTSAKATVDVVAALRKPAADRLGHNETSLPAALGAPPGEGTTLDGLWHIILADIDRRLDSLDADADGLLAHYRPAA
jgi:hypothetical protein